MIRAALHAAAELIVAFIVIPGFVMCVAMWVNG